MSKLIDEMAEEMAVKIMKRSKDVSEIFTRKEVVIYCTCFLRMIKIMVSEFAEDFVKKEILKMNEIKQRFHCNQCQLIWETTIHPYIPDHKEIRMEFDFCPNPRCKSKNITSKLISKPVNPLTKNKKA